MTDKLINKIKACQNPTCVGLDTSFDYLPDEMKAKCKTLSDVSKAILEFNVTLIDKLKDIIPSVKVQVAYYEMYGHEAMKTFADTLDYAKKAGLITIADVKRNDIGSTAGCYSSAYLGSVNINGQRFTPFDSDYITVNGYLGGDGIEPFLKDCRDNGKGIFVLVKTSNPSSGQLQNKKFESGETLFEAMGDLVEQWGEDTRGEYGYSSVGAVVGATHPKEAAFLREKLKHTLFLIPGYGAQGGSAADLAVSFDKNGNGGIVNNSRGILCAYKNEKYKGQSYATAAYNAAVDMREDIMSAISKK